MLFRSIIMLINHFFTWRCVFCFLLHCVFAKGDVVCESLFGYPLKYCYGLTAYCCGLHFQDCCWQSVWKIWWFWVVIAVIFVSFLSCCGYVCSGEEAERFFRSNSITFYRWRRTPEREPLYDEEWKPVAVALPPYSQEPSTSHQSSDRGFESTAPQQPSYQEPPPPYETTPNHPQPPSNESVPLAPTTGTRSYNTTVSSQ